MLIDISRAPWQSKERIYYQTEKVSYAPMEEIISMGYRECIGLKTSLAYYHMPIYVKFNYFKKCDYKHGYTDKLGNPVPEGTEGAYP